MTLLLLALACSGGHDNPHDEADHDHAAKPAADHDHAAKPAAPPADHAAGEGHTHAAGEEHSAPHGGELKSVGPVHLEARFLPQGLMLWVSDAQQQPLRPDGFTGSVVAQSAAGVQTAELAPMGDHLHAAFTLEHGQPASAVVTIVVEGQPRAVPFEAAAVGLSVHDHTALHGGVVGMVGDVHVEYAPRDGVHRFFFSDERRQPLTGALAGQVLDGGTPVPLAADPTQALLSAPAAGAGSRPVVLEATVGGAPVSLSFKEQTPVDGGAPGR